MVHQKLTRVKLIHNPNYVRSGVKSYVSLLKKYSFAPTLEGPYYFSNLVQQAGKPSILQKFQSPLGGHAHVKTHQLLKKDASTGQSGTVPAEDEQNDSEYLCQVSIGTPAQTLTLDFDTGSSDLWVWSTKLSKSIQSQGQKSGHTIFDPSKSSTWKLSSDSTWQISYGDSSSASGVVGTDNVTLGGLTIKQQAVEIAEKLSAQFEQGPGDGLLGLAWGSINTVQPTPVATPVENMITQDDIPKDSELFTAHLANYKDTGDDSFYTFGFIDQDVLTTAGVSSASDIQYASVDNSQGFWMIPSASASVGGTTVDRSGNTSIMDTGTTLCLVDDTFLQKIYAAIPGAKGWTFPSSTSTSDLPVVTVAIGDTQFTINPENLAFADAGNGMVYGGIQSRGTMTFDIYGDVVLKSIYAIFDQGNQRFGAVQRASGAQSGDASAGAQATTSSAHAQKLAPWTKAALNLGNKLDGKAGDAFTKLGDNWSANDLKVEHHAAEIAWKERNREPYQYSSDPVAPVAGVLSDGGSAGSSCTHSSSCGGGGC